MRFELNIAVFHIGVGALRFGRGFFFSNFVVYERLYSEKWGLDHLFSLEPKHHVFSAPHVY